MLADAIRTMYEYNRWGTSRLLAKAEEVTSDQWLAPGTAGHGSMRDTFIHVLNAQRGWLSWWDGTNPTGAPGQPLKAEDLKDVAAVRAEWEKIEGKTRAFVSKVDETTLARVYSRKRPDGFTQTLPLWQMMLHVANHGTQHRSEVAAMLTAAGLSPGNMDMTAFYRERGAA